MDRCLLFFIVGTLASLFLPIVPPLFYILFLGLSCFYLLFFVPTTKLFCFLLGLCYLLLCAHLHFSWTATNGLTENQINSKAMIITGTVDSLIVDEQKTLRFNFLVEKIAEQSLAQPFLVRLTWQKPHIKPKQGNLLQLKVKLKPAHGLANSGAFSYQRWLLQKRIVASGYVKQATQNNIISEHNSVRQKMYQRLQLLQDSPLKPLFIALAIGDKTAISQQQWQVLSATGTQHLIAISGLHLGLIALFGLYFARGFIYLVPASLLSQRNSFYLPIVFSLSLACFYAYLAGFATPTVRALIMLLVYWGLRVSQQKVSYIRWLLLSISLIIVIQPFAILDASFYLSVTALICILFVIWRYGYLFSNLNRISRFLCSLLLIQLAINLLLLPLTVLLFGQVSLLSPLANIVVVPLLSFTAIPLSLVAAIISWISIDVAQFILSIALFFLDISWQYLQWLSQFEQFVLLPSALNIALVLVFPVFLLLCSFRFFTLSQLSAYLFIFSCLGGSAHYLLNYFFKEQEHWQLVVFDVGQGLSVLIQKQGKAILYDTGAAYPSGFNMVDTVIQPYLQQQFIKQLDFAMISHSDNDHAGGIKQLKANNLASYYYYNDNNNLPCQAGKTHTWQGLELKFIWPNNDGFAENDDSCVLLIKDGNNSILLPGDISSAVEERLVRTKAVSKVSLLISPHHGSSTSSSLAFLNVLSPEFVVHSTGFYNRWQFPKSDVVSHYKQINAEQFNTAETGMLIFDITKSGIKVRTYRQNMLPFWPWRQVSVDN
ncbi:DNA internalization-related competence protein ComEC/Rec2 [Thalassomonas sp. M1454]|uniref:DNA internalization-related competence protein ComEC/Rec2 n=1 Tax=Thalassomonas sp. M1454 TaxID=2594477 RepID=UPI001180BDA1|nr:DNA internalization-related competence protein ComEC/Rec2 [Thalassomonas sp. M1454]TRX57106.1 DNA internalization-related competence protein ComEC/Rec2 [Thalassomonas sp. M1454]